MGPPGSTAPRVGEPGRRAASSAKPSLGALQAGQVGGRAGDRAENTAAVTHTTETASGLLTFPLSCPSCHRGQGGGGEGGEFSLKQGSCISLSFGSSGPCSDGSFLEPAPVRKQWTCPWKALRFLGKCGFSAPCS